MKFRRSNVAPEHSGDPQKRTRNDLIFIGILVLLGCLLILSDPDRAFEWITRHKEVQIDEFLSAVVILGSGFAAFSWRRWTDLGRQISEYKRLQAELTAMGQQAALQSETDDLLQSCLTVDEAHGIAIRYFEKQFPKMSGAIFAIPQGRNVMEVLGKWGMPAVRSDSFPMEECWGLRRGRINRTLGSDPKLACEHIGPIIPDCAICVPMMAHGEILGILYFDTGIGKRPSGIAPLSEAQERAVRTLSEHLSLAVANLNLRESLRIQSIRDPLTGLFNRRYMEESLEREIRRAMRKELLLSILMVDIDHFKAFNDAWGHEAGDAILREIASLFQQQMRAEDIACRYGGEEFLLVLPEADVDAAQKSAERLLSGVRSMQVAHYGKVLEGVTLSIGIACFPGHATTPVSLIHAADAALYRAKENGRNQSLTAEM
jgi:diguanylate cyclase (GGDEF)-like protein